MSAGTGKSLAMLPFFVRDYIAATRHLSLAERGAYTDLLFLSWEMGSLPKDPARLARLVGCDADEFAQVWPIIRSKFTESDDGLVNARLEEHRTESMRRSEKARESALASWNSPKRNRLGHRSDANADANAPANADANADALASANGHAKSMLPSPSPSPSPEPSAREEPRKRGSRLPADFEPDLEYARKQLSDIDAAAEADRFKDFWMAKSGKEACKADWPATWRNWIRTCRDSGRYARSAMKGSAVTPLFR